MLSALGTQLVGRGEPLVEVLEFDVTSGDARHLVHDDIGLRPRDRLADRDGVEAVERHGLGARLPDLVEPARVAGGRDDLMAAGHQLWNQSAADRPASPCNEHLHVWLLLYGDVRITSSALRTRPPTLL